MNTIAFSVDINPIAKGRPRFCRRGIRVLTFTPQKTRSFENELILKSRQHAPRNPLTGPIVLEISFYMPIPASRSKVIGTNTDIPHLTKPDLDNLLKGVSDAFNGLFWEDDSQVWRVVAVKLYAEKPRIDIKVSW
jgi:Holliday junction resolvase RusA-like endonuclease